MRSSTSAAILSEEERQVERVDVDGALARVLDRDHPKSPRRLHLVKHLIDGGSGSERTEGPKCFSNRGLRERASGRGTPP